MTLSERAKNLSKEEVNFLGEKMNSLDLTIEEYSLYVLHHENTDETKVKKDYSSYMNLLGQAKAGIY